MPGLYYALLIDKIALNVYNYARCCFDSMIV